MQDDAAMLFLALSDLSPVLYPLRRAIRCKGKTMRIDQNQRLYRRRWLVLRKYYSVAEAEGWFRG